MKTGTEKEKIIAQLGLMIAAGIYKIKERWLR
jgi:hypothetical protein